MGADSSPPYLYEAPSRRSVAYPYSDFNPKRVSQNAYYTALSAQQQQREHQHRPKREGPLINFNEHPDSYLILPQKPQRTDLKALPPGTKKAITVTRWVQFALRLVQLIGCIGLLVLVIFVKGAQNAEAWIMRIPPAWDILITLYAIYHLQRPAKGRTPASSSSYHVFALSMDIGLIPFYVYIAMVSQSNYVLETGANGRWRTYFDAKATNAILLAIFVASIVQGALHLISIGIDIYLFIVFRKIAQLPQDMNPLEDNLTSRGPRQKGHKYKNSDAPLLAQMSEKKGAQMSESTVSLNNPARASMRDSYMSDYRAVPFGHSRLDSDTTFSPHNPDSARYSRQQYEQVYQQSSSARDSRPDLGEHRNSRTDSLSPSKKKSFVDTFEIPSAPSIEALTMVRPESRPARPGTAGRFTSPGPDTANNAALTDEVAKSQQKEGLLNDNWYVMDDENETGDIGQASTIRGRSPPRAHDTTLAALDGGNSRAHQSTINPLQVPQPLKSHPPSPTPDSGNPDISTARTPPPIMPPELQHLQTTLKRNPTIATDSSSIYSRPSIHSRHSQHSLYNSNDPSRSLTSTPKNKYYGDLQAATLGIRGPPSPNRANSRPGSSGGESKRGRYAASHDPQRSYHQSPSRPSSRPGSRPNSRPASRSNSLYNETSSLYNQDPHPDLPPPVPTRTSYNPTTQTTTRSDGSPEPPLKSPKRRSTHFPASTDPTNANAGAETDAPGSPSKHRGHRREQSRGPPQESPTRAQAQPRVISRSGADFHEYQFEPSVAKPGLSAGVWGKGPQASTGGARRREVSGKVAEEGRGGVGY
ncbi:hypothetical protein MBLNU230_g5031t1 [Neophaeotheca triangularis]